MRSTQIGEEILICETYRRKQSLVRKLVDVRCLCAYPRCTVGESRLGAAVSKEAGAEGASELCFIGGDIIFKCYFSWTDEISAFPCVL